MATSLQFNCNGCGKQKQATNHWWMLVDEHEFCLISWDSERAALSHVKHFCGQDCTTKALSKWMQEKSAALSEKGKG